MEEMVACHDHQGAGSCLDHLADRKEAEDLTLLA